MHDLTWTYAARLCWVFLAVAAVTKAVVKRKKRRRDPVQTREKLVAAALEVIADHGYDAARSQDIVRRAGLTNGALYAHFSNKNELLLAALREEVSPLGVVIAEQEDRQGDPLERLFAVVQGWHRFSPPDGGVILETLARARRDKTVREFVQEDISGIEAIYARWIREGQANGSIDCDVHPAAFARLLSSIGLGYQSSAAAGVDAVGEPAWIGTLLRVLNSIRPTSRD